MLPGRLLVHGGARHDPHTPWLRRGRSCREVTAIAVEREELFGEQRGEVVGADHDVEVPETTTPTAKSYKNPNQLKS